MQEFLFGAVFLVLIISGIFSYFEIVFMRKFFEIKSTKYIKLLKILEILFFLMIFFGEILFIAFTFLYFLVLFSDFKKKIILILINMIKNITALFQIKKYIIFIFNSYTPKYLEDFLKLTILPKLLIIYQ